MAGTNLQLVDERGGAAAAPAGEPRTTRERFRAWLDAEKLTLGQAAKRARMKPSTLTEILNEKYRGNSERLWRQIDAFLAREEVRRGLPDISDFVLTTAARAILATLRSTHAKRTVCTILGDAGPGKSFTLQHYAATTPGVVYVRLNVAQRNQIAMLKLLCRAARLPEEGATYTLYDRVAKTYAGGDTLFLIDEVQHASAGALEVMRALHDDGCGAVAFVGNSWTFSGAIRKPEAAQLHRRILHHLPLHNAMTDAADVAPFITRAGAEPDVAGLMLALAKSPDGLGKAIATLSMAMEIAGGKAVTKRHWQQALEEQGEGA